MTMWSHCVNCGRELVTDGCAWCALRMDDPASRMIMSLEWVTRRYSKTRCAFCPSMAVMKYRTLAASAATKGCYCREHVPLSDPVEARRVLDWIARRAYEQA